MRLAILVVLCAGCVPGREVFEQHVVQEKEEFKDIPVQLNREIDILFVLDSSGSMAEEQASLAASFPVFVEILETMEGGLPNVHIGVISTDLGAGGYAIPGCQGDGDGGDLLVGPEACRPTGAPFITDVRDRSGQHVTNYPGTLAEAFACNATVGTRGCGFEQPLESMRRALDGSNLENNGFLRADAYLVVVFITDEDDCSAADPALFGPAPELGPLTSFRCFDHASYLHEVREYVDFLKSLKEDDSLIVTSVIAGDPEPVVVGIDPASGNTVLLPSCQSDFGSAAPAVRLTDFAEQFPNRNQLASICDADLSEGLALVAELLKEALGVPCVEAMLEDQDLEADGLQFDCSLSEIVNPWTDHDETVLPHCDDTEAIPCWHFVEDVWSCPETPTHLRIVVERGGGSVARGTHVQLRCATE